MKILNELYTVRGFFLSLCPKPPIIFPFSSSSLITSTHLNLLILSFLFLSFHQYWSSILHSFFLMALQLSSCNLINLSFAHSVISYFSHTAYAQVLLQGINVITSACLAPGSPRGKPVEVSCFFILFLNNTFHITAACGVWSNAFQHL